MSGVEMGTKADQHDHIVRLERAALDRWGKGDPGGFLELYGADEMVNPQVVVDGHMALLTYNLVNYIRDPQGGESVGSRWNSTTVFQRQGETWKSIHSHWSFTRHQAFQNMSAEASEGLDA